MIDKKLVEKLAQERIDELDNGCYLVDITVSAGNAIFVAVDNETRGVAVEDCISISRNIEHNLDREVEDFSLEVSSPGVDKGFMVWKQYKKYIGKNVKVLTNDGTRLEGELVDANEDQFQLQTITKERVEGKKKKEKIVKTHAFSYNDIKQTKLIISFK